MRRSEAAIFTCFAETVVAPAGAMPPVARTDALEAFGRLLDASPALNRAGVRAALWILELAPLATDRRPLRRLSPQARLAFLERIARSPLNTLLNAVRAIAHLAYYGDPEVMRSFGYDADAIVARGRELRAQEARW